MKQTLDKRAFIIYSDNMKNLSIILIAILFTLDAQATQRKKKRYICSVKTAVVAVIDTGFEFSEKTKGVKLCKYGHKDFSSTNKVDSRFTVTPVPTDSHGHGTNIAGLIQKYAGNVDYCMVILKYYDPKASGQVNLENSVKAIRYATDIKADYINYSGGGSVADINEVIAVKRFLNRGGKMVAAAGNERTNIDFKPFYPAALDSRIVSVGSTNEMGIRLPTSNFGTKVTKWEIGYKQEGFGKTMTGTSQAAAITMGKIIKEECAK